MNEATSLLTTSESIRTGINKVLGKGEMRIAVAFWGDNALEHLGLTADDLSMVSVICNLSVGATSAAVIRTLLARGAQVRALSTLHAKVYLGADSAIVGSANASTNALSESPRWNEACVHLTSPADLAALHKWFAQQWDAAADLNDTRIARLLLDQAEWDNKRNGSTGAAPSLLDILQQDPRALDGEPLHVTLDWTDYSTEVAEQVRTARKATGLDIDAWEDWPQMPAAAEILSFAFDADSGDITYQRAWRTPANPKHEMDPRTNAILVANSPLILRRFALGDQGVWLAAVQRFKDEIFSAEVPDDKGAIRHISKFAEAYLFPERRPARRN
ncbi:TPA: phospholipase D family protein [Stenotrophomonas maltophilia]|nr:phospholipase D family protein [Stenotrophomonas maltophilia]